MKYTSLILNTMDNRGTADQWLDDVYCAISEAYYSGATLSIDRIEHYRGVVEAAHKLDKLDEYEADLLYFQLFKIECRNM
jgi:hypothetical protein